MRHQSPRPMQFNPLKLSIASLLLSICNISLAGSESGAGLLESMVKPDVETVSEIPEADVLVMEPAAQLAEKLAAAARLTASFTQQTVDKTLRILQESTGQLWVNPGGKFRIETTGPSDQILVSDGTNFWVYDADLEQVIISRLEADLSQVPVLLLGGNLADIKSAYAVSYYEDEMGENYVLSPMSSESLFTSLSISFQQSIPVRIAILDALGQRTVINLADVKSDHNIPPATFLFTAPPGTDVIDDRL